MKRIIFALMLIAWSGVAVAGTLTTNYGLNKPADGEFGWGSDIRENADTIDTELKRVDDLAASAAAFDSGTATGGGATTLTDTAKAWGVNSLTNMVMIAQRAGITIRTEPILSNTAETLTVASGTVMAAADTYSVYTSIGSRAPRGNLPVATTGGTTVLTVDEFDNASFDVSGTLVSNATIEIPDNYAQIFIVDNETTGAFTLTVKHSATAGVVVSQGTKVVLYTTGTVVEDASTVESSAFALLSGAEFTGLVSLEAGSNIASATTVDLTAATGNLVHVTGTTTTTAFTMNTGQQMVLIADGAWPLTYNATTLKLNGGISYTCAAGDRLYLLYDGTTTTVNVTKQDGTAVVVAASGGITLGTAQATTSGTSIDFTGIPAGTKRITILFNGVSTNGTSPLAVQLGDAGGLETTGYISTAARTTLVGGLYLTSTTMFLLNEEGGAVFLYSGRVALSLHDASTFTWTESGMVIGNTTDGSLGSSGGYKPLSAELDRIRLTTVNGTDAFDAGSVNIQYEE